MKHFIEKFYTKYVAEILFLDHFVKKSKLSMSLGQ